MIYDDSMLPIEREMWARYAKFQPAIGHDDRLPNLTRVLLEYDETGRFIERDHVTGEIVDVGVLPMIGSVQEAA